MSYLSETSHKPTHLPEHKLKVLLTREQIEQRVQELAKEIVADFHGTEPLVITVLKGSFVFVADLIREMSMPLTTEFIRVSSYGNQVVTSGEVKLELDLDSSIGNRHVLLVEDIVDTGLTLEYLKASLEVRKPASLRVCSLLHKPGNNVKISNIEYVGFNIPNDFVVGYGLDYQGYYRNLPQICQVVFTG